MEHKLRYYRVVTLIDISGYGMVRSYSDPITVFKTPEQVRAKVQDIEGFLHLEESIAGFWAVVKRGPTITPQDTQG